MATAVGRAATRRSRDISVYSGQRTTISPGRHQPRQAGISTGTHHPREEQLKPMKSRSTSIEGQPCLQLPADNHQPKEATTQTGSKASIAESDAFLCPISHVGMIDPVLASDGKTYDRFIAFSAIDSNAKIPGCPPGSFKVLGEVLIQKLAQQTLVAIVHLMIECSVSCIHLITCSRAMMLLL